jgi:phosphoglycerate dehydrogenase-like enzyme
MSERSVVVVQGRSDPEGLPGLETLAGEVELRYAPDLDRLREALPGADVVLGSNFRSGRLREVWSAADRLRWIHWTGAGVDALLFPELIESEVVVTNSRGIYDGAMAEYVLGLVLDYAKDLGRTHALQQARVWQHRLTERIAGTRALVVGTGSIGREIARMLRAVGIEVTGVGRRRRENDPLLGTVHGREALDRLLPEADWVVLVTPRTPQTEGMFGAAQFEAMKPTARFINLGRGALVDEEALIAALRAGALAGAALDVFGTEPLPPASPLWTLPGVIVSPHMSGDFFGYPRVLGELFLDNFRRYRAGEPLRNVVDKAAGY